MLVGIAIIFVAPMVNSRLGKYLNVVRSIGAVLLLLGAVVVAVSYATGEIPIITEETVSVSKLPNLAVRVDFPVCVRMVTKTYKYASFRTSTTRILLDPKLFDPKDCASK
jgi:hypothetical protein